MPNRNDSPFASCPLPFPTDLWRGRVKRVKDGDSCIIDVDRGYFDQSLKGDRFISLDVYERFSGTDEEKALGKAARQYVIDNALGRWCYIHTAMDREKYGRILEDIYYLGDDGDIHDLSVELERRGYMKAGTTWKGAEPRQTQRIRDLIARKGGLGR